MRTLFQGLDRAYGTYEINKKKKVGGGTKNVGTAKTIKDKVSDTLWEDHLKGETGLGIVPIMDDSNCRFGAIDIDVYEGLDIQKIFDEISEQGMPLVPFRTKSGGLHLFCFTKEDVTATLMQSKLSLFASVLGFGGAEIFPKQTEILADRGDIGQWINMPYFDYENSDRHAWTLGGKKLSIEEFFKMAESVWFRAADLEAFSVHLVSDIADGPPCLQQIVTTGFQSGTRNDGFFNIAIYLKKAYPDDWEAHVDDYNNKYLDPPIQSGEIQQIIKSVRNKDYGYTCNKSPLKDHCNSTKCRGRKFGIGDRAEAPVLTALTKYDTDPPLWFVNLEGSGRLELTTEDLQSQLRFQRKCMEQGNIMPPIVKAPMWQSIINKLMEKLSIIEAPQDASPKGLLFEYLERFCTGKAQAKNREEVLMGKAWTDSGKHWFRMMDFIDYLERNRFKDFKVQKISSILKQEMKGEHHFVNLKGKGANLWSISSFARQTEDFDKAKIKNEQPF